MSQNKENLSLHLFRIFLPRTHSLSVPRALYRSKASAKSAERVGKTSTSCWAKNLTPKARDSRRGRVPGRCIKACRPIIYTRIYAEPVSGIIYRHSWPRILEFRAVILLPVIEDQEVSTRHPAQSAAWHSSSRPYRYFSRKTLDSMWNNAFHRQPPLRCSFFHSRKRMVTPGHAPEVRMSSVSMLEAAEMRVLASRSVLWIQLMLDYKVRSI